MNYLWSGKECWKAVARLAGLALASGCSPLFAKEEFEPLVRPFLQEHCFECHGEKKQKGDVRLDMLESDFSQGENAVLWQDVSDLLITGDMPPEDEPRPPADAVSKVIEAIDAELRQAAESAIGGSRIAIRRLSHSALDNTVRDLLGVDLQLSENLPTDAELDGFDNLAVTLDANPELILKLQNNAQKIAEIAVSELGDLRESLVYLAGDIGHGDNAVEKDGFIVTSSSRDRKYVMWPKDFAAPRDGVYRIKVTALANDPRWEWEREGIEYTYQDEGRENREKRKARPPNDRPRLVSIVAIQASEARHMDAATVPGRRVGHFYVRNELESDELEVRLREGENIMVHFASGAVLNRSEYAWVKGEKKLAADLLYVKELELEGPANETWPSLVQTQLLDEGLGSMKARIGDFLFRAFRRPVPRKTVRKFEQLFHAGRRQGLSDEEAMQNIVIGVLCSPRFLFNHDDGSGEDPWAVANRLSYFLWNSMPDEELLRLAKSGHLVEPEVLRDQAFRLLSDEKAERFIVDFTAQWLGLKDIELMKPDPKLYKDYDPLLEKLMRRESEVFFTKVLDENLPVSNFLDSDFLMINERLATHYEIEGVSGSEFREVALHEDSPRGGLLGQASILKLTSDGTRTSPVVRGVWVLENLLGDPPSPPPADVEPIEPDVRGSKTIFEMLSKHREVETCADCHSSIDPWGFGLEHFDAIGSFREEYRNGLAVYAKGQVSGEAFDGAEEMKRVLEGRTEQFTRALTEKLFTYALGHPLTFAEQIVADDIAAANLENEEGFKDLVVAICVSALFRGELSSADANEYSFIE